MSTILNNAVRLAALNLAIFPVRPNAKLPAINGWQTAATADPDEAERLIRRFPGCNLGVATGEASGVFVLDVDNKGADGFAALAGLQAMHGELSPTWRDRTPSGGEHWWFEYPTGLDIGNRAGFLPGLDIRGNGGLVVVPPSTTGAGAYEWIVAPWDQPIAEPPGWLIELACTPAALAVGRPRTVRPAVSGGVSAAAVVAELIRQAERVEHASHGTRNDTLFKAAADLGELVGAGVLRRGYADVALEVAAELCGLVQDDGLDGVQATIDSGLKRGMAKPREIAP